MGMGERNMNELVERDFPQDMGETTVTSRSPLNKIYSKIAGGTFEGRQEHIAKLKPDTELTLRREKANMFDRNAIAVTIKDGAKIGYIKKELAREFAPLMDGGKEFKVSIASLTGLDSTEKNLGVNLLIQEA